MVKGTYEDGFRAGQGAVDILEAQNKKLVEWQDEAKSIFKVYSDLSSIEERKIFYSDRDKLLKGGE